MYSQANQPPSMGSQTKPFIHHLLLILITTLKFTTSTTIDYTTLIYKGCANQPLQDPNSPLNSIFTALISHSTASKFFKTTISSTTAVFQCRGDVTDIDCYNCVQKIPTLFTQLCGSTTPPIAARIQLLGCYIHYESSGFPQISGLQLLYKKCGSAGNRADGLLDRREAALAALQGGIGSGSGFFATSYGGVYVVAQCEGDLGIGDCEICVKNSVERVETDCGSSVFGQVYLHKCFVSYSYYPNGAPRRSSSQHSLSDSDSNSGEKTGKTVAIILGGALGIGFVVICLLFARSLFKKHDDDDD